MYIIFGRIDSLQDWDRVGARLAGAVLGSCQNVSATQGDGDGCFLDWRRLLPTLLENAHQQFACRQIITIKTTFIISFQVKYFKTTFIISYQVKYSDFASRSTASSLSDTTKSSWRTSVQRALSVTKHTRTSYEETSCCHTHANE